MDIAFVLLYRISILIIAVKGFCRLLLKYDEIARLNGLYFLELAYYLLIAI